MIFIKEYAWCKYLFFRDNCTPEKLEGSSNANHFLEVSLMGQSENEENLNVIVDMHCVKQEVSSGSTDMDDDGLADYVDRMSEEHNVGPLLTNRVWFHTHPGNCPKPSPTDEETFKKYWDNLNFAVMFILARDNSYYNYMKFMYNFSPSIWKSEKIGYILLNNNEYLSISDWAKFDSYGDELFIPEDRRSIFEDYSDHHEEWLKEMKDNVSQKYSNASKSGTVKHSNQLYGDYTRQSNYLDPPGRATAAQKNKIEAMIECLIDCDAKYFGDLNKKQKANLCSQQGIKEKEFTELISLITKKEKELSMEELIQLGRGFDILDDNQQSRLPELEREDLKVICGLLHVRPHAIAEIISSHHQKVSQR